MQKIHNMNSDKTISVTVGVPRRILPVIVLSQFAGTSLWFAANAVMPDMQRAWKLPAQAVGALTSAVQLGFVMGTLVFALLMVADRFSPSRVFMVCASLGALANAVVVLIEGHYGLLLASRFAVGFLLAGVYPVGMKIAASWYHERLDAAMGVLIGAMVLGTALPHGLRALGVEVSGGDQAARWWGLAQWQIVILSVSLLATMGGLATALWVPDSPTLQPGARISPRALSVLWRDRKVRASVWGYWGHMWELYAFFVLLPLVLATRLESTQVSIAAFVVIAGGALGCTGGGWVARYWGGARVAGGQLAVSGLCCILAPLMLTAPLPVFMVWLVVWGVTVSGDSPQFSALTAQNAPREIAGSVLTFSNCIGFMISIISIELFVRLAHAWPLEVVLPWLGLGPLLGVRLVRPLMRRVQT